MQKTCNGLDLARGLNSQEKPKSEISLGNGKCLQFPQVLFSKQKPWESQVLSVQISAVYSVNV